MWLPFSSQSDGQGDTAGISCCLVQAQANPSAIMAVASKTRQAAPKERKAGYKHDQIDQERTVHLLDLPAKMCLLLHGGSGSGRREFAWVLFINL